MRVKSESGVKMAFFQPWRWLGVLGAFLWVSCAAPRTQPHSTKPASPASPASAQSIAVSGDVPAIAQREVIRRQEQIRRMDEAALRASEAMAHDDLEGAVSGYRQAIDGR